MGNEPGAWRLGRRAAQRALGLGLALASTFGAPLGLLLWPLLWQQFLAAALALGGPGHQQFAAAAQPRSASSLAAALAPPHLEEHEGVFAEAVAQSGK